MDLNRLNEHILIHNYYFVYDSLFIDSLTKADFVINNDTYNSEPTKKNHPPPYNGASVLA